MLHMLMYLKNIYLLIKSIYNLLIKLFLNLFREFQSK